MPERPYGGLVKIARFQGIDDALIYALIVLHSTNHAYSGEIRWCLMNGRNSFGVPNRSRLGDNPVPSPPSPRYTFYQEGTLIWVRGLDETACYHINSRWMWATQYVLKRPPCLSEILEIFHQLTTIRNAGTPSSHSQKEEIR